MNHLRLAVVFGMLAGATVVVSCAIDESGTLSDSGGPDVFVDGGFDVVKDVAYDVPDLGVGETESGLPCTCVNTFAGYTLIEYVPDQQPPCTAGYDGGADYVENPTAAATTCACSCASTPFTIPPKCACGADPAVFPIHSGNNDCTSVTGESLDASTGSCYANQQQLNPGGQNLNKMLVAPPANPCVAAGGTCGSALSLSVFPDASAENGRACNIVSQPAQGSCASMNLCVPNPAGPYQICITNGTVGACTNPSFPVPHLVGSPPIVSTRSCGPATCACTTVDAGSCGTPALGLWNGDNNCGGGGPDELLPADNSTCTQVGFGNGQNFHSARYFVPQDGGACGFTGTYAPQGGLSLTNQFTVCCR